jgi:hypothetical protein
VPLIQFIQDMFPHLRYSAGFIACLITIFVLSTVLYIITRYKGWLVCMLAAGLYTVPFFFYMR